MNLPWKSQDLLLFQGALFFIPVNIYLMGDGVAAGIQWVLFRYQQSYLGNSFIVFSRDLFYIQEGYISGTSVIAAEISLVATILLIIASVILVAAAWKRSGFIAKISAITTGAGALCYLVSDIIQYGIFLNGTAGFVLPIGIPVMIMMGFFINQLSINPSEPDGEKGCSAQE